ncbi:MAG: UvrD-helicase domain-containing protein, partial [Rhodobacteraceae bacterium]|nr:UvrD-helicase domain-containing protein [Paracoccaceae bacterium]
MAKLAMFDDATRPQVDAATPGRASWVSANAGSGKTRVLTDRVARLLLAGAPPQRILCLTFTIAAAANMQVRLFDRLGEWSMLPDTELKERLLGLGEPEDRLNEEKFAEARTLF